MNAAYAVYILASIALVALVYRTSSLDFRGAGRLKRVLKESVAVGEEADFAEPKTGRALAREKRRLTRLAIEPRADLTVLLALGGAGALLCGAAVGFLGPLALEATFDPATAAFEAGPRDLAALSYGAAAPFARLAQVVGAVAGAAIALRMLRIFMGVAALTALVLLTLAAANFTIGRPALALFG